MPFAYLRDPLFLICFSGYWLNRALECYGIRHPIVSSYFNDLICVGFWIPPMIWAHRRLGIRDHDAVPMAHEIAIPLVIFGLIFEVLLPITPGWTGIAIADPYDILCYAMGGLIAAMFWRCRYGRTGSRSDCTGQSAEHCG